MVGRIGRVRVAVTSAAMSRSLRLLFWLALTSRSNPCWAVSR